MSSDQFVALPGNLKTVGLLFRRGFEAPNHQTRKPGLASVTTHLQKCRPLSGEKDFNTIPDGTTLVIITVFCSFAGPQEPWQSELMEYSWRRSRIGGELLRLYAAGCEEPPSEIYGLRTIRTTPWSPHPYTQDVYPQHNIPSSLVEWLFNDNVDATLLLLDANSILCSSVKSGVIAEIPPGTALANPWGGLPKAESGPFALGQAFDILQTFCINDKLSLPNVAFPILIHSSDLKKMAPRWLELTSLIRASVEPAHTQDACRLAYSIAAAEFRIQHQHQSLADSINDQKCSSPILSYGGQCKSKKGAVLWDSEKYIPWEKAGSAKPGSGVFREFQKFLNEYVSLRQKGEHLSGVVPTKLKGIREARVIEQVVLEIPGNQEGLSLNQSAAAIWALIDDQRSMVDIAQLLEGQFELPAASLWKDIDATVRHLHSNGAIGLFIKPIN